MAYVPGQKLDEEQQAAQASGAPPAPSIGSTPGFGGSAVGSSPVAQSNGSQGGAGTGFTNIDQYLGANKGAGAQVKAAGDKALGADAGAFSAANKTVADNVASQNKPIVDPNKLVSSVVDGGKEAAITSAKNIMANTFKGPGTVDYNVGNTEQMKQAQALGNAQSAGTQLAKNNGPLLGYGQTGLSAIDSAIYGSQQEKGAGVDAVAAARGSQVDSQTAAKGATEKSATDTAAAIKKQADDVRSAFQTKAGDLYKEAQDKASAANAQELFDRQNGVVRDPSTGAIVTNAKAQEGGWENGTGQATAQNFWNAAGLSNIGKALGDTGLAGTTQGPAYVSGRNTTAAQPAVVENVLTKPSAEVQQAPQTTAQIANATRGMTAEQLSEYQRIRREHPRLTAAQAAEDARNGNDANVKKYDVADLTTRSVAQ